MARVVADITWEFDGNYDEDKQNDLPEKVDIPVEKIKKWFEEDVGEDEEFSLETAIENDYVQEKAIDWLSDVFGFLIENISFDIEDE